MPSSFRDPVELYWNSKAGMVLVSAS